METRPEATAPGKRTVSIPAASPRAIEWAAEELESGSVVAFPTDTVYGIAASLSHADAIDRIFAIKGRDIQRKLPILISSSHMLENLTSEVPERLMPLLAEFWPGPVTFVMPTDCSLPAGVVSDNNTIAVRVPNHPLAIELIEKAGGAVACTSANQSNELPALRASDVEATLGGAVDFILDGGVAPGGVASTIVFAESNSLTILREGPVEEATIRLAWENYVERG